MDVEITKSNGQKTRLSELDVEVRDFRISSVGLRPTYSEIEGRHGVVNMGATYGTRTISVPFYFKAYDLHDVALLRDELYSLITDTEPFYVREMRRLTFQTGENKYVGGKRYKVRLAGDFDIEQMYQYGFGEMVFETTDLPFAESIGTTQTIERNGISANDELWGFGMGLQSIDETLRYTHTETSFRIFNAGNVPIHPFEQFLKITISNVQGSSSFLQLLNNTNGTVFRINETVTSDKSIVIDGPIIKINSLQEFRKTNRKYIELEPGWNQFTLTGATSAKVEFDFRFYYL